MRKKVKFYCFFILFFYFVFNVLFFFLFDNNFKDVEVYSIMKMSGASASGFLDENFYACVVDYYNSENSTNLTINDSLTDEQLSTIDEIICKNKNIVSITGIEKLSNLTKLNLMENNLENVDLSKNIKLMYVELSGNPKITSIGLSKNTSLKEIYFRNDSLKSIDLSKNINLENLDLGSNELSSIDLTNNINLKYVELSGNPKITSIDLSKNTSLKEIYFRNDSLKSIDLSKNINLENLDLGSNELSSIDLTNNINLKYVVLSGNQLTNIDLSKNTNITELYISSNNLSSLDLSNLSKLTHLNAVFNKFDNISIPCPENIIHLVIEADWVKNYNFSVFTNLKSLRITDYYVIPVYGTTFNVSNLYKYKSDNVNYSEYILYSDFNNRTIDYVNSSDTITGNLGGYSKYTLCSTNISGYHSSCGNDLPGNIEITFDDNITINDLNSYFGIVYYEGYRELRYMSLTSDRYSINENSNTIEVDTDDDVTILNNLSVSWNDAVLKINNNKLEIFYNGELIREFSLKRVSNPKTGMFSIYIVILLLFVSGVCSIILHKYYVKKSIV